MNKLAKLLEGRTIQNRFDRYYNDGDFGTGCIGCGDKGGLLCVCTSAMRDIKGIVARAMRRGYSEDDAEKI